MLVVVHGSDSKLSTDIYVALYPLQTARCPLTNVEGGYEINQSLKTNRTSFLSVLHITRKRDSTTVGYYYQPVLSAIQEQDMNTKRRVIPEIVPDCSTISFSEIEQKSINWWWISRETEVTPILDDLKWERHTVYVKWLKTQLMVLHMNQDLITVPRKAGKRLTSLQSKASS